MKLTCEWFVLAEKVLCDLGTRNLTLVNCLERVSALSFPAQHPNFAFAARYRRTGAAPTRATPVTYRLIRLSEGRDPEEVVQIPGTWTPEEDVGRTWVNFQLLRLFQPETIRFRLDHRIGKQHWTEGPTCSLEVARLTLNDEQRATLQEQLRARGLPTDGLV